MGNNDSTGEDKRLRDGDTGRYTYKYDPQKFLDALRDADGITSTGEIADAVGSSRPTAYAKLQELEEQGQVRSKKPGHDLIWILTDDEE